MPGREDELASMHSDAAGYELLGISTYAAIRRLRAEDSDAAALPHAVCLSSP